MNVWNAPNAMSASKLSIKAAFLFASLLVPSAAHATNGASSLYNVKEVVVQFVHFVNTQGAETCGLTREDLMPVISDALKNSDVPAVMVTAAKPPQMDKARIEMQPDIITMDSEDGLTCTSWISLTAQSQNTVRIPPVDTPRSVNIVYWKDGLLITTGQTDHKRRTLEGFEKLAKLFAQQYRIDQPPDISAPDPDNADVLNGKKK